MKISDRLKNIVDMITVGNRVADIGTDHGYVPVYLCEHRISPKVIAMDINEGPLFMAKQNIKQAHFEDRIETRLSAGFEKLNPNEVDTAVIAGMGGELIKSILSDKPDVTNDLKELILSPHSEIPLVRRYLQDTRHQIVDEKMLMDEGKYYVIIKTARLREDEKAVCYSDEECKYGPVLLKNRDAIFLQYLQNQLDKYKIIMDKIKLGLNQDTDKRYNEIRAEIEEITDILNAGKQFSAFKV